MSVPAYLQAISQIAKTTNSYELVKIKCTCGCTFFQVYKYFEPEKIVKRGFNEILRKNDKLYLVKRNFFGRIVQEIEYVDESNKRPRNIVKVKCQKCGREHIIFDNYKHGYNATITSFENTGMIENVKGDFQKVYSDEIEVFVKIYQDISYEQFKDEFSNLNYETYLNSFGNIEIYGVNSKLKRIKILSEEVS